MQEPQWSKDLMKKFLDGTKYSGTRQPKDRTISASSLGKEPYYLMLEYLYGKSDDQEEYGANTTGSIYQLGIDSILKDDPRYWIAKRMKFELPNGWIVSGEIDIYDTVYKMIIDDKLLSGGGFESAIKDDINSDYNLQQAVYVMLMDKVENIKDVKAALHAVNKAGSAGKKNILKNFELTLHDVDTIIEMLIKKTDAVQYHIDNNSMPSFPDEVCDIFKYGKTNGVANRCKLYCDYRDKCPQYQQNSHITTNLTLKALEPTKATKETYLPGKDYQF